jgi:hypothetical protein
MGMTPGAANRDSKTCHRKTRRAKRGEASWARSGLAAGIIHGFTVPSLGFGCKGWGIRFSSGLRRRRRPGGLFSIKRLLCRNARVRQWLMTNIVAVRP